MDSENDIDPRRVEFEKMKILKDRYLKKIDYMTSIVYPIDEDFLKHNFAEEEEIDLTVNTDVMDDPTFTIENIPKAFMDYCRKDTTDCRDYLYKVGDELISYNLVKEVMETVGAEFNAMYDELCRTKKKIEKLKKFQLSSFKLFGLRKEYVCKNIMSLSLDTETVFGTRFRECLPILHHSGYLETSHILTMHFEMVKDIYPSGDSAGVFIVQDDGNSLLNQCVTFENRSRIVIYCNYKNIHWISIVIEVKKSEIYILDSLSRESESHARKTNIKERLLKCMDEDEEFKKLNPPDIWTVQFRTGATQLDSISCGWICVYNVESFLIEYPTLTRNVEVSVNSSMITEIILQFLYRILRKSSKKPKLTIVDDDSP